MFVTNHVLAGAVIGNRYPGRPVTAFLAGVGSHLAMDAVPHWGCDGSAPGGPERFFRVARRDGLLGLAVVGSVLLLTDRRRRVATTAAIVGSVVLDLDKPGEHFFGVNPFPDVVQRIHGGIQRESRSGMPVELAAGALLAFADGWMAVENRRNARARGRRRELSMQCSSAGQSPATLVSWVHLTRCPSHPTDPTGGARIAAAPRPGHRTRVRQVGPGSGTTHPDDERMRG